MATHFDAALMIAVCRSQGTCVALLSRARAGPSGPWIRGIRGARTDVDRRRREHGSMVEYSVL